MPLEIRGAHFLIRSAQLVRKTRLEQALRGPTHTHPFNGPFSRTTRVSRYQKGETNLDFTEARDSDWTWHQLSHMQVCTSLQTDNHASTPPLSFVTGRMPFLPPNRVMYQDCYQTVYRYFTKSSPPAYLLYRSRPVNMNWHQRFKGGLGRSECLPGAQKLLLHHCSETINSCTRTLQKWHFVSIHPRDDIQTDLYIVTNHNTTSLAVMLIQQLAVDLISNSQTTVYSGIHERSEFIPLQTLV